MKYSNIEKGIFLSRPNRFIANIEIDGSIKVCHVKNTGRCAELLIAGADVLVERSGNPDRKTEYDLVAVYKDGMLINIDSQAPNKVFGEWAETSGYFGNITAIRAERTYKSSRFDWYIEADGRRIFVEVKGVTLEHGGVLMFPDAPTERGVKHLKELAEAVSDGYEAYVFFVAQMEKCKYFTPNRATHPQFADALREVAKKGVNIRCVNCKVDTDGFSIKDFVDIVL